MQIYFYSTTRATHIMANRFSAPSNDNLGDIIASKSPTGIFILTRYSQSWAINKNKYFTYSRDAVLLSHKSSQRYCSFADINSTYVKNVVPNISLKDVDFFHNLLEMKFKYPSFILFRNIYRIYSHIFPPNF